MNQAKGIRNLLWISGHVGFILNFPKGFSKHVSKESKAISFVPQRNSEHKRKHNDITSTSSQNFDTSFHLAVMSDHGDSSELSTAIRSDCGGQHSHSGLESVYESTMTKLSRNPPDCLLRQTELQKRLNTIKQIPKPELESETSLTEHIIEFCTNGKVEALKKVYEKFVRSEKELDENLKDIIVLKAAKLTEDYKGNNNEVIETISLALHLDARRVCITNKTCVYLLDNVLQADLKSLVESHLTEYKQTKSSHHWVRVAAAITVSRDRGQVEELLALMRDVADLNKGIEGEAHSSDGDRGDRRFEPRAAFTSMGFWISDRIPSNKSWSKSLTRSFSHPVAIHCLALEAAFHSAYLFAPVAFRLLASDDVGKAADKTTDLSQWDELLRVATRGWEPREVRAFAVEDAKEYRVYRLYITATYMNENVYVKRCRLLT
jgi:hypothetical protein